MRRRDYPSGEYLVVGYLAAKERIVEHEGALDLGSLYVGSRNYPLFPDSVIDANQFVKSEFVEIRQTGFLSS